ncbi:helix-turn-helix domain-containing protein [Candidatus Peregrinibacteria bacterium]|jgi:hypothetical protein|nr:helix-turn-helix domain-containing protein [Candidatus Peregrinibacteria bacterium]MBT7736516.1 helix-turn-helix domain-containing protein [Candidatus Peregrinibacteria bacterium]
MAKKFLTIQEAADLSNKSVQTIRRAIKAKKLGCKKQRTPQGFNYMVNRESLYAAYNIKIEESVKEEPKAEVKEEIREEAETTQKVEVEAKVEETQDSDMQILAEDLKNFTKTLDRMVTQHADERQNFMRLVNTLQEKIFVLENQMNLLKEPSKKWYQVWK